MTQDNFTKTVALYGGSFNPPHEGHLTMAAYVQKTLEVDETWMMFSQNPEKDPAVYPALHHRMNMANVLARHFDEKLVMSDLEAQIAEETGHCQTYFILDGLRKRFPEYKFVFVMGADSFSRFHQWEERGQIPDEFIVAVVDRPGYTQAALESCTAKEVAELAIDITDPNNLRKATNGWCFLNNPHVDRSSSGILQMLAEGKSDFEGPFAEVVDYIYDHGLYGTTGKTRSSQFAAKALVAE